MSERTKGGRLELAERLRRARDVVAEAVTDEFFHRHPDWLARYGERGRRFGVEDARFHLDFLAGAVETGSPAAFEDYARWVARMLSARGIDPRYVVENLEQVGHALRPHLAADDHTEVIAYVQSASAAAGEGRVAAAADGEGPLALARSLFLQTLLLGHRKAACNVVLEAVRAGHPVVDLYRLVLQESLHEVGRLWEANRITVAAEHMATAIVQFVMAQLYPLLPAAPRRRGRMVITGVEGELHQVGANMVADVLEADGWDVRFLGTNTPHEGVLHAIEEHRADVVGISTTMLFNVPKVRRLVADVRQRFVTHPPRVLVGGGAFRCLPDPAAEVAADSCAADVETAVALLGEWADQRGGS